MRFMPVSLLREMISLPPLSLHSENQPCLEVSLIIPARKSAHSLEQAVSEADAFMSTRFPNSYEIILVPNPGPEDSSDLSTQTASELSTRFKAVRVHIHTLPPGKGAAIRTGF